MDIQFGSFVIVGAFVSLLVQFLKNKFETKKSIALFLVLILSCVAGSAYYFLNLYPTILEPILAIIGFSGAVYTFIIEKFEKDE